MTISMKQYCIILFSLCFCVSINQSQQKESSSVSWNDSVFTVHGRLMICNGTPSFRIWIIGTTHILGIDQVDDSHPRMPDTLKNIISFGKRIYGDYTVKSISKYKQGAMQYVQVISCSHLVIKE
jgi:hypothetical protein